MHRMYRVSVLLRSAMRSDSWFLNFVHTVLEMREEPLLDALALAAGCESDGEQKPSRG